MAAIRSNWSFNAWCVSTLAKGDAASHIPTGWLEMLRRGFLHRDVSIGNTLMLDPPVTTKPFEAQSIKQLMTELSLQYEGELAKSTKLLEDTVQKVGHSDKCHGFIIDGDMAASLEGYFTSRGTGEVTVSIHLVFCENPTNDYHAGDV